VRPISKAAVVAAGSVVFTFCGGASVWTATGEGPPAGGREAPAPPDQRDRAHRAALETTGPGDVTNTEYGDGDCAYAVEVTLDDGRRIDVHVDETFTVVGTSPGLG
jgi:hypothetical protein